MYTQKETQSELREIFLPSVTFQLLVSATCAGNVSWAYQEPTKETELPLHLQGKRVFTFMGVHYVEE